MSVELKKAETRKLEVKMPTGSTLTGSLTGSEPKAGWIVNLRRERNSNRVFYSHSRQRVGDVSEIDAKGRFRFEGLPKSTYSLYLIVPHANGETLVNLGRVKVHKDLTKEFAVAKKLPGRLHGRVKLGAPIMPGRLMMLFKPSTNHQFMISGIDWSANKTLVKAGGSYSAPLAAGEYTKMLIDTATGVVLWQDLQKTKVTATQATELNVDAKVRLVKVRLKAAEGGPVRASRLELIPQHPTDPRFGTILRSQTYDSGMGMRLKWGQKDIEVLLPNITTKIRVRSDAHQLDPNKHRHNFPPLGEAEWEPSSPQRRLEITVEAPNVDVKSQRNG